jgi:hypothetical protein
MELKFITNHKIFVLQDVHVTLDGASLASDATIMTCFGRRRMGIGSGSWPRAAAAVRDTSHSLCPTAKWQTATVRQGARYIKPRWQTLNDVRHIGEAHVSSHCPPVPAKLTMTTGDEARAAPPHTNIIVMIIACLRGRSWEKARGCFTEAYLSTDRALSDSRLAVTGRICEETQHTCCMWWSWYFHQLQSVKTVCFVYLMTLSSGSHYSYLWLHSCRVWPSFTLHEFNDRNWITEHLRMPIFSECSDRFCKNLICSSSIMNANKCKFNVKVKVKVSLSLSN